MNSTSSKYDSFFYSRLFIKYFESDSFNVYT